MEAEENVKFSLLENGLDFIWSALERLEGDPSDRDLKYAVIHLGTGVELVLKERLRQENWEWIFSNLGKASRKAYEAGDFSSVKFDDCLERLERDVGVEFKENQKDDLKALRRKRNRIEHFNMLDTPEAILSTTANALSALLDFVASELASDSLPTNERILLESIRKKTGDFEFFVNERMERVTPQLEENEKQGKTITTCPSCKQEALTIDDDIDPMVGAHCYFCRYCNADSIATASEYITNVQGINYERYTGEGGVWPQFQCPSCNWEALVDNGRGYLCFGCGTSWELGELTDCCSCGRPIENEEGGIGMCHECFEYRVRKSD